MFRDEGGNFGDDPRYRLLALLGKGSVPISEMDQNDKQIADAINTASGVTGSIRGPKFSGIGATLGQKVDETGLAERIKQAAQKSNIKVIPTAEEQEANYFKEKYKNAPSFFEKYGKQPEDAGAMSNIDKERQAFQQKLRDDYFQERNDQQLQNAKDYQFQNLRKMFQK